MPSVDGEQFDVEDEGGAAGDAWLRTDGAARAEPNLFGLCRVVTEEGEASFNSRGQVISQERGTVLESYGRHCLTTLELQKVHRFTHNRSIFFEFQQGAKVQSFRCLIF